MKKDSFKWDQGDLTFLFIKKEKTKNTQNKTSRAITLIICSIQFDFDLKVNKIIPITVVPKNKQIGNVMI